MTLLAPAANTHHGPWPANVLNHATDAGLCDLQNEIIASAALGSSPCRALPVPWPAFDENFLHLIRLIDPMATFDSRPAPTSVSPSAAGWHHIVNPTVASRVFISLTLELLSSEGSPSRLRFCSKDAEKVARHGDPDKL
jgi:hypothetical protein